MTEANAKSRRIDVTAKDLPLHCPLPDAPLWSRHPRVFLNIEKLHEVMCPYCGTHYVLTGDLPKGH